MNKAKSKAKAQRDVLVRLSRLAQVLSAGRSVDGYVGHAALTEAISEIVRLRAAFGLAERELQEQRVLAAEHLADAERWRNLHGMHARLSDAPEAAVLARDIAAMTPAKARKFLDDLGRTTVERKGNEV